MDNEREKQFAKIFTSKMYHGNKLPMDERLNAIGRLLTDIYNNLRELNKCECGRDK